MADRTPGTDESSPERGPVAGEGGEVAAPEGVDSGVSRSEDLPGEDVLFEHILVPIDGSQGAARAIEHALDLAQQYEATVHVLHVIDEQTHVETPALSTEELLLDKLTDTAEAIIEEVVVEADRLGVETVRCCCRGLPHDEIAEYAEANDIDLIVMGVHGDSRAGRPHVGSTTERVIRGARIPVLPV